MEKVADRKNYARVESALAAASLTFLAGCGYGSYELPADTPVTVLDKYTRTHFKTPQETGGYPHYEDSYHFIVEQCDDVGLDVVEADGCVDLRLRVSEETYNNFEINDTIVYRKSRRVYPVNN